MQNKTNDKQPAFADDREGAVLEQSEGWDIKKLSDEASQKEADEVQREVLRGDETKGDADDRDVAGSADSNETPHGREEAKNDVKGKANANG